MARLLNFLQSYFADHAIAPDDELMGPIDLSDAQYCSSLLLFEQEE
ncbi:hypothetical protein LP420_26355 [Massilia sp. B-10]|nr:hypothetical protein LP420_26355 [Massilia sp. B-10]